MHIIINYTFKSNWLEFFSVFLVKILNRKNYFSTLVVEMDFYFLIYILFFRFKFQYCNKFLFSEPIPIPEQLLNFFFIKLYLNLLFLTMFTNSHSCWPIPISNSVGAP